MTFQVDFSDSASDYLAAAILKVWTSNTFSLPSIGVSDVDGGTIVRPIGLAKTVTSSAARIAGFRTKMDRAPAGGEVFLAFNGASGAIHAWLEINALGRLRVVLPTTTLTDTTTTLTHSTNYVLEFGCLVSNTVGRVEVKVNGTQIAALTSIALGGSVSNTLDTQDGATSAITSMMLDSTTAAWRQEVDWIWTAWDTVVWGSSNWLGVVTKDNLRPKAGTTGNGVYNSGWTVGAGSTTVSDVVGESTMDSDTSFALRQTISSSSADRFSVKCDALPAQTSSVKLMSHRSWYGHAAETGPSSANQLTYEALGLTTHDASTDTNSDGYQHRQSNFLLHPNGAALSKSLIDNTQIGVRAVSLTTAIRCTNENMFVLYVPGTPTVDPPGTFFDSENQCPIGTSFQAGLVRGQGVCA